MKYEAIIYKKVYYSVKVTIDAETLAEAVEIANNEADTYDYKF